MSAHTIKTTLSAANAQGYQTIQPTPQQQKEPSNSNSSIDKLLNPRVLRRSRSASDNNVPAGRTRTRSLGFGRYARSSSARIISEASSVPAHTSIQYRRILDRSAPFNQSKGIWRIKRKISPHEWRALYTQDPFHSLVNAPTKRVFLIILGSYFGCVSVFALLWLMLAQYDDCGMDIKTMQEAYMFSLQTMTTIGYGTSDYYFGNCVGATLNLTCQVTCALIAESVCMGVIFLRLSRGASRASTIVFSQKAVIRRIRGRPYLMFQVCELRKHQLVEAHVKCYAIRHDRDYSEAGNHVNFFQAYSMRLTHPDDELGGSLLLVLPSLVVHEIDRCSPLLPPSLWLSQQGPVTWNRARFSNTNGPSRGSVVNSRPVSPERKSATSSPHPKFKGSDQDKARGVELDKDKEGYAYRTAWQYQFPDLVTRDSSKAPDAQTLPQAILPSAQQAADRLVRSAAENLEFVPTLLKYHCESEEMGLEVGWDSLPDWQREENEMMKRYMEDRKMEIVVIVEGSDSLTSASVQARHSYTVSDVVWDHSFQPCVFEMDDGSALIDFSLFHELRRVPPDSPFAGPVPQYA